MRVVTESILKVKDSITQVQKEENFKLQMKCKKKKKNFMASFYGWGSTVSRLEPLPGGSLLFTTQFPEIPGTHFINLGRIKG